MEFALTEEQQLIQDSAKRMVEKDILPVLADYPADRSLPRDGMAKIFPVLAAQGLTAPRVPVDQGGTGMKMLDYALIYEQLPAWLALSIMGNDVTATAPRTLGSFIGPMARTWPIAISDQETSLTTHTAINNWLTMKTRAIAKTSRISGKVIRQNCCQGVAPSRSAGPQMLSAPARRGPAAISTAITKDTVVTGSTN